MAAIPPLTTASIATPTAGSSMTTNSAPCVGTMNTGFMGYAVEFSPFDGNRVAVATSQHFGVIGNGRCMVASNRPALGGGGGGVFSEIAAFDTKDGVYDVAWSECVDGQLVFACGDGSIKLWDTRPGAGVGNSSLLSPSLPGKGENLMSAASAINPSTASLLRDYKEHTAEVYGIDWNLVNKENIISGAWDNTIKLWHPNYPSSIRTYKEHLKSIYATIFHPRHAELFISASGDGTVKIWDMNSLKSSMTIKAHNAEILTVDWNKYYEYIFATGSVDKTIRLFDMRNPRAPIAQLDGHQFAVRRIKFSPHSPSILASVSYDMTLSLWDYSLENALLTKCEDHTEFVLGVDFNNFNESQLISCSWDETMRLWNINGPLTKAALEKQKKNSNNNQSTPVPNASVAP